MPYVQDNLHVEAERLSSREKRLTERLREYPTLDGDIAVFKSRANGFGLNHQPSVTAAPFERDYLPYLKYLPESELDETEDEIAATIERYIHPDTYTYASQYRVTRDISKVNTSDPADIQILTVAQKVLYRSPDEGPKLNDTERIAEMRLEERAYYQQKYEMLEERKRIITVALDQMQSFYLDWYKLLIDAYVKGEKYAVMWRRYGSEKMYRTERKNALAQFDKWTPGLI